MIMEMEVMGEIDRYQGEKCKENIRSYARTNSVELKSSSEIRWKNVEDRTGTSF